MSLLIEYQEGRLSKFEKLFSRNSPSPLYFNQEKKIVCSGELFDFEYSKLMEIPWIEHPEELNNLNGSIAVAKADEYFCNFAIDMNGLDTFYYYHQGKHFLLSDSFWDIVKVVSPCMEDINREFVRESLFEGGTQDGNTILKNIKIVMPNQHVSYNAQSNELKIRTYYQFRYSSNNNDVNVAVERMDKLLHSAINDIKKKCGDVKYGVGISGGLDSRIISHYANANKMKVVGFNICVPKPHGVFLARSIKNAHQIAKAFDINYQDVEWKPECLKEKIKFSIEQDPNFTGSSFKYESKNLPDFDVLLTGATGPVVGSMIPADIKTQTTECLVDSIYQLFASYSGTNFVNRFSRAVNYLFGGKQKKSALGNSKSWFGMNLIHENYDEIVHNHISDFVQKRKKQGLSNIDIFVDYFLNVCGYRNRNGAFESLLATKRSFSIYVPFLFKETMTWTEELLLNRKALNELIVKKVPEVADIKSESFHVAPGEKMPSTFSKIISMIEFLIRGNGTAIEEYYLKSKRIRKQFIDYMNESPHDWFHRVFNIESLVVTDKVVKNEPNRMIVRIWELKALIDCLEKKEYLTF